ncbi:protein neprosin-like [Gastrolobium bilobum]|uniref:protein neprosin-like n=1 Tax=Gastrolobium bilobum TaxID=150636 RepID=UPI002AAFBEE6|nr:protein neprosin-like [Gastrolobium bilobum]
MIIIILLCLCFTINNFKVDGWMPSISKDEYLDLEQQLKLINKPPIKTIQTEFGHIVDCIDINKQLAFDNPLLKNHKLQLKPSFRDTTTKVNSHNLSTRPTKIGLEKNMCPRGTVPIRRTTKEDLIRAKSLSNINGILTKDLPGRHFAEMHLKQDKDTSYYGVSGTISTYNPTVTSQDQMSGAYIWVSTGTDDSISIIFTGWQVYPAIYGDNKTHFFTSWSDGTRHTGCYNLLCSGFVQVDKGIYLGAPVSHTSTYGGTQFGMELSLWLDPHTKNWWLKVFKKNVGYFPAALFSNMVPADQVGWTGSTITDVGSPSPPMGSGDFPNGDTSRSCYFRQITFRNENQIEQGPSKGNWDTFSDIPNCYDVKYYGWVNDAFGYTLLFGGPGGNCGN